MSREYARTTIGIGLIGVLAAGCTGDGDAHRHAPSQSPASSVGRDCWVRILTLDPEYDPEEPAGFWVDLGCQANAVFWEKIAGPMDEDAAVYFAHQFGQLDGDADLRWMVTAPVIFLPDPVGFREPPAMGAPNTPDQRAYVRRVKALQLIVCRTLIRRWYAEPNRLDRYYRLAFWSGTFLTTNSQERSFFERFEYLKANFANQPPKDIFWWQARSFIMCAHATGRDDLWQEAKPEDLPARCAEWVKWLESLRPQGWRYVPVEPSLTWEIRTDWTPGDEWFIPNRIPERPFPDYDGTPAPPHPYDVFRLIRANTFWTREKGALIGGMPDEEWRRKYEVNE